MATRFETASEHTFLVSDGVWEAHGRALLGADAREAEVHGRTEVRGLGGGFVAADSIMTVQAEVPFEVRQAYEVQSTSAPERLTFLSRNDRIGELVGELWLLPDYILMHYASPKGRFRGSEILIRRSADHYTAIGQFVADRRAQTVWEVELRRTSGA